MRLRTLKCYSEVRQMVLEGQPVPEVVRFIQEEAKEYTDVTVASLTRTLYRYKNSIPPADFLAVRLPRKHVEAQQAVASSLDELKELKQLYDLQFARIKKLTEAEKGLNNVLFPNLTQEIRVATEILNASASVKRAAGLFPPPSAGEGTSQSAQTEADLKELSRVYEDTRIGTTLRDPESVHRVVGVLKTITTLTRFERRLELTAETQAPKGEP